MRGDLIQTYKIINGYESIKLINGINFSPNQVYNLRKNTKGMVKEDVKNCMHRYHFFVAVFLTTTTTTIYLQFIVNFKQNLKIPN